MTPTFNTITPPVDVAMPETPQNVMIVLWGIFALCSAIYCIRHSLQNKSWLAVNIFIGSGLAMFGESMIVQMMNCWYPAVNQVSVYQAFGNHIPLFACLAYLFYFAPGILIMNKKYEEGITQTQFWTIWGSCVIFTLLYELAGLSFNLWHYYGNQGLTLWKLPLTWPVVNTMTFVPFSVVIFYARPYLKGPWMLFVIPAMAAAVHGFEVFAGFPLFVAMNNSATPDYLVKLAALTSMGIAVVAAIICAKLVCVPAKKQTSSDFNVAEAT